MKRRLWIEIDADAETCGSCQKLNDELRGRPSCDVFDTCLQSDRKNPDSSPLRCTGCLAAEDAAKPEQASEDDDDPVPHHLQEVKP